jgi:leucyl aminopeptidase
MIFKSADAAVIAADKANRLLIIDSAEQLVNAVPLSDKEIDYVTKAIANDTNVITVNQYERFLLIYVLKPKKTDIQTREQCRKTGADIHGRCNALKISTLGISNCSSFSNAATLVALGMGLANYQFLKYRKDAAKELFSFRELLLTNTEVTEADINYLNTVTASIYKVRDLINEPVNFLSAEQLSAEITAMGAAAGFGVTVLHKEEIEAEKMGGLLAVNLGSMLPPTFTIMEYKPENAANEKPIVLVGKGIVFDTGGVSLKPTLNSMDSMKSDMSGAAVVSGIMYVAAKLQLPIHLVALVPATDNRPGENAYVPQDIITMYDGTFVEVLNTDAEGRMVLADALHYAKRYDPEFVADFATLTGAASAAIGEHGLVCMGTASDEIKQKLAESGNRQYERMVEFPLWEEYGDQIKSDVAEIKNIGGATGGAITAGKFLEHFTNYPWMHFDIAGVAYLKAGKGYYSAGGTGFGIRMFTDFLMNYKK